MPVVKNVIKPEEAKPVETHNFDIYDSDTSNLGVDVSNLDASINHARVVNEASLLYQKNNEIINNIIKNNTTVIDNTVFPYRSYEETRKRIASQLKQTQQERIAVDASEIKQKEMKQKERAAAEIKRAETKQIPSLPYTDEDEFSNEEIW